MVLAALLFSAMGVFVKLGAREFSSAELVFYRSLFGLVGICYFVFHQGQTIRTSNWCLLLTRGAIGSLAILLYFAAISKLALATAVTLNNTSPIFLTAATMILFRERPRWWLILSVGLGFAGILFLLHPVFDKNDPLSGIIGLSAGFCGGMAFLSTRELGKKGEPPWRVVFYLCLIATIVSGTWMSFDGVHSVRLDQLPLLLGIGASATLAQLAMTRAYRDGHVLIVGSFSYLTVVFISILGIVLWGEYLLPGEWIGIGLIVVSGVVASLRKEDEIFEVNSNDI